MLSLQLESEQLHPSKNEDVLSMRISKTIWILVGIAVFVAIFFGRKNQTYIYMRDILA